MRKYKSIIIAVIFLFSFIPLAAVFINSPLGRLFEQYWFLVAILLLIISPFLLDRLKSKIELVKGSLDRNSSDYEAVNNQKLIKIIAYVWVAVGFIVLMSVLMTRK